MSITAEAVHRFECPACKRQWTGRPDYMVERCSCRLDDGDGPLLPRRFVFCGLTRVDEADFDEGGCSTDICPRCGLNEETLGDHAPKVWPAAAGIRWSLTTREPDADGSMGWELVGPDVRYDGRVWPDLSGEVFGEKRWDVRVEGVDGLSRWRQVTPEVAVLLTVPEIEQRRQQGRKPRYGLGAP